MAERRMFSKTLIDSDLFLDMPLSTQALYFHLSMRADDDGFINNPKKIQKIIGGSEDDVRVLISKKFIIPFESGVVVIKHWKIHNYIQKDRYRETIYKNEKNILSLDNNNAYSVGCIQDVYNLDTQDRLELGEDSLELGRDIVNSESLTPSHQSEIDYNSYLEKFKNLTPMLPRPKVITDKRKKTIRSLISKLNDKDIETIFKKAQESDFLSGRSGKWTGCNFDWLISYNNAIKVLEGAYDNRNSNTNDKKYDYSNDDELMQSLLDGSYKKDN